jgi:hypothetical protein
MFYDLRELRRTNTAGLRVDGTVLCITGANSFNNLIDLSESVYNNNWINCLE